MLLKTVANQEAKPHLWIESAGAKNCTQRNRKGKDTYCMTEIAVKAPAEINFRVQKPHPLAVARGHGTNTTSI